MDRLVSQKKLCCQTTSIAFSTLVDWLTLITTMPIPCSYWTHAATVDDMNADLREAFVEMHNRALLEDLRYHQPETLECSVAFVPFCIAPETSCRVNICCSWLEFHVTKMIPVASKYRYDFATHRTLNRDLITKCTRVVLLAIEIPSLSVSPNLKSILCRHWGISIWNMSMRANTSSTNVVPHCYCPKGPSGDRPCSCASILNRHAVKQGLKLGLCHYA